MNHGCGTVFLFLELVIKEVSDILLLYFDDHVERVDTEYEVD